jgi:hypothetical protein
LYFPLKIYQVENTICLGLNCGEFLGIGDPRQGMAGEFDLLPTHNPDHHSCGIPEGSAERQLWHLGLLVKLYQFTIVKLYQFIVAA